MTHVTFTPGRSVAPQIGALVLLICLGASIANAQAQTQPVDPFVQAALLNKRHDYRQAAAIYAKLAADEQLPAARRIEARHLAAISLGAAGQHKEAIATMKEAIKAKETLAGGPWFGGRGDLAAMLIQGNALEEAKAVLQEMLKPEVADTIAVTQAYLLTAKLLLQQGDDAQTLTTYKTALSDPRFEPNELRSAMTIAAAIPAILDRDRFDPAVFDDIAIWQTSLKRAISKVARTPTSMETVQLLLVQILIESGRFEDALSEARVLVSVASTPQALEQSVLLLARALKGIDGNLARANRFLQYQKTGPAGPDSKLGTDDDLADPLAGITMTSQAQGDDVLKKTLDGLATDWSGRVVKARLLQYWGRPREALEELKVAYVICPVEQKSLQQVTDQVVRALVQASGDPRIGERFLTFQKYGPAGLDGKPNTADDLQNPLQVYTATAQPPTTQAAIR